MSLNIYNNAPFSIGNQVDEPDVYTGDGVKTDFNLANKTIYEMGATVTFNGTQYYQYTGGFVKTASGFSLDEAPPVNSQGVAPGLTNLLFDDIYDTDVVDGVPSPRTQDIPFYLADVSTIHLHSYEALPSQNGVVLSIVDNITSYGAQTSWVQLACADSTAAGASLTFSATGINLETSHLSAFGTLLSSVTAGATAIFVDAASSFALGDYILFNIGSVNQEVQKIIGFSPPNELILSSVLNFNHSAAEGVWTCGRKFWMRCTIPPGGTGGEAVSLYDLALRIRYVTKSRF